MVYERHISKRGDVIFSTLYSCMIWITNTSQISGIGTTCSKYLYFLFLSLPLSASFLMPFHAKICDWDHLISDVLYLIMITSKLSPFKSFQQSQREIRFGDWSILCETIELYLDFYFLHFFASSLCHLGGVRDGLAVVFSFSVIQCDQQYLFCFWVLVVHLGAVWHMFACESFWSFRGGSGSGRSCTHLSLFALSPNSELLSAVTKFSLWKSLSLRWNTLPFILSQ